MTSNVSVEDVPDAAPPAVAPPTAYPVGPLPVYPVSPSPGHRPGAHPPNSYNDSMIIAGGSAIQLADRSYAIRPDGQLLIDRVPDPETPHLLNLYLRDGQLFKFTAEGAWFRQPPEGGRGVALTGDPTREAMAGMGVSPAPAP